MGYANQDLAGLSKRRSESGLTQSELARLVGVSQATISLWENGKAEPDEVQTETLLRVLSGEQGIQPRADLPEGFDPPAQSTGWGDYPLDAVFVRTDQRTVVEVVKRIRNDRYDLNPEFQRDFIWSQQKQSRLIESCVMRIPLPVLYVAEAHDGRIIVVDGLQRLSTFRRFLDNELKLSFEHSDDTPPHPLEGKRFADLDLKLQERVEDTQLTLYILDSKAPERAKLDIFERVNSGEPLTRQQMRNCLYNGQATRWLKEAAESEEFIKATASARSLDPKKMRDREVINRFCAFVIVGWKKYTSGDMDSFLAEALDSMNRMSVQQLTSLRERFSDSMQTNYSLFRQHAFRKSLVNPNGYRSVLNIAFFDVCSVVLSSVPKTSIEDRESALRSAIIELLQNEDFEHSITYSTNSRKQVERRFMYMEDCLMRVLS